MKVDGLWLTDEWRMGVRKVGSGLGGLVIADEKTYQSKETAMGAASQRNRRCRVDGKWEYVPVRVELRLVEVSS